MIVILPQPPATPSILEGESGNWFFRSPLSEIAAEAFGEGRFECHWLARGGMAELKPLRMEHLPIRRREDRLVRRSPSVRRVTHDGTSNRGHVHAYLVRAPREDVAFHERDHAAGFPDVFGDGFGMGGERAGACGSR